MGNRTTLGNGTDNSDVYVLEFLDIKTESGSEDTKYEVNYYDAHATTVKSIWDVKTSDEEPIIPVDPTIFETSLERRRDNNNRY